MNKCAAYDTFDVISDTCLAKVVENIVKYKCIWEGADNCLLEVNEKRRVESIRWSSSLTIVYLRAKGKWLLFTGSLCPVKGNVIFFDKIILYESTTVNHVPLRKAVG